MDTRISAPRGSSFPLWLAVAVGLALVAIWPISLALDTQGDPSPAAAPVVVFDRPSIMYSEFGRTADRIWRVDPAEPTRRQLLLTAEHAPEYGIIAALQPQSMRLAYNALSPREIEPTPASPATLWLADLQSGSAVTRLAERVDLLVPPVWSNAGNLIAFRRTTAEGMALFAIEPASGRERTLVADTAALFPVAFRPGDDALLYVRLDLSGSDLYELSLASGEFTLLSHLSDELTRDWKLAPDGSRLAFLAMSFERENVSARAHVLDLTTGHIEAAGAGDRDAFNPTWNGTNLTIGTAPDGSLAGGVTQTDVTRPALPAPERGFDVPLGWSPTGSEVIVLSFDGTSASQPGRAALTVVGNDGTRRTITTDEVTFLGWINP